MLKLSFRQTKAETMVRAAATLIFNALTRSGLPLVPLSNLTEDPQYGFTASSTSVPVGPKFVRITDLQDAGIDWDAVPYCECEDPERYLLQPYDLLFARTGATTGKTHLVIQCPRAIFASYLIRLRPKPAALAEYLYSFFQSDSYWSQISDSKEGSAQPNVNGRKLLTIAVPFVEPQIQSAIRGFLKAVRERQEGRDVQLPELPPPLHKQRRVVSRIEELAGKVGQTRTLRTLAQEEGKALLDSGMNCIWENGDKWQKKPIRILATPVSGQIDPRIEPFASLPHINGECIESGTCRLLAYRLAKEDGITSGKFHFNSGAILYSKIRPYLRKAVQVPVEGVCSADVYAFETFNPEITPRFFMYSLVSPPFTTYANSLSGRTRMPKLNQNQLFAFEMSYPALDEQHRVVNYLDNLQAKTEILNTLQSETAAELDALMPSILSEAFRGKL